MARQEAGEWEWERSSPWPLAKGSVAPMEPASHHAEGMVGAGSHGISRYMGYHGDTLPRRSLGRVSPLP